jgi:tight adherence protein C
MIDYSLLMIMALAFAAVTALVFASAQFYTSRLHLRRRLTNPYSSIGLSATGRPARSIIAERFGEEQFGVDGALRQKLRRELQKAGFFRDDAINYYIFARICTVVVFPLVVFFLFRVFAPSLTFNMQLLIVGLAAMLGVFGPDGYLSRRQRQLAVEYRLLFPDLLDLLVVCVSAGLSIAAAFDRVREEFGVKHGPLGMNLAMMTAEIRAGRSMMDALNALAGRLGLDEAAALVAVLRQSVELGGDVGDTLRVYSDEMRDKRLLRAEETANKLSVKIVLPLGAFIFPVILFIVLVPIMLKLMKALN